MQRDFGNRGLGRKTTSNIGESPTCRPGEAYVPMEYCATRPPNHAARPGAVFGRLGISHRHAEVLYLVAGIRELAVPPGVPPGETGRRAGPRLFLLRGPLRAGRGRWADGTQAQRVSQDRRPPSRQRRAPVAAHLVLSRRAADRPQHEGPAKTRGGGVRRNRTAPAPLQRYAAIGARPVPAGDRLVSNFRLPQVRRWGNPFRVYPR